MSILGAIGLGASVLGSVLGSSSASKAASQAADVSERNNQANIDLFERTFAQNQANLDPFRSSGVAAGNQINALLGLDTGPNYTSYLQDNPDVMRGFYTQERFNTPEEYAEYHYNTYGRDEGRSIDNGSGSAASAASAFNNFRNSTGYEFRLGEGLDAVQSSYAGIGALQSGAAARGLTEYGQNFASNEFGNYINTLTNQQSVGAGAASSLAGVSQNFASNVANSNTANANNQANALLTQGNNNPLANAAGILGGGILGFGG